MGANVETTLKELSELSKVHESVAVAFSGGKDSRICLDLALRHFKRVIPFYMQFVPGLECEQNTLRIAKERWGLDVMIYPNPAFIACIKTNNYIDPFPEIDEIAEITRIDIFNAVIRDTGTSLILSGEKKSDGMFRRRLISARAKTETMVYLPLKGWLRWEVLNYLKAQNIPVPVGVWADNAGVSLMTETILWLYQYHPKDYETLRTFFPYIEAVIRRWEWFGVKKD